VAMPTSPVPAFPIGERTADPVQMSLADVFTVSANLAGLPAISVPCGFTAPKPDSTSAGEGGDLAAPKPHSTSAGEGGLPIGLQLTGRRFDEPMLLRIADAYERDTEWSTRQ